jgi:hypothetical protein
VTVVTGPSVLLHSAATRLLAAQPGDPDPNSDRGPEWGKAAPIGLLVILLLGIAVFFLVRSLNRQLKRVPKRFGEPSESPSDAPATGSGRDADPDDAAPRGRRDGPEADPAATGGPNRPRPPSPDPRD